MIVLGLTGSIGMGKSTVAGMFRRLGVPVFDADAEVHRLQGPGGALLPAIEAAFPGMTGSAGVDRVALGQAVFGDAVALRRLQAIVHPAVRAARAQFLRGHRRSRIVIDDVPLLFESGGVRHVDAVIVVSAPAWKQRRRVLARPGMTPAKFRQILARQMADREKRRRADFLIDTGRTPAATACEVYALVACVRARGVRYCRRCARLSSIPKRQG
jgi:dephospho-CoA kinase